MTEPKAPAVLFLCIHNAGRSQMAAGWMRRIAGPHIDVYTGGSEPADSVNPAAVAAMGEVGIDITGATPRRWTESDFAAVDVVVTMGCGDECPYVPGKRYLDWPVPDPAGRGIGVARVVRDEIEQRVRALAADLGVPPSASETSLQPSST